MLTSILLVNKDYEKKKNDAWFDLSCWVIKKWRVQVTSLSLVSNMQLWIASLALVNVRVVAFKFSGLTTFFIPFRFQLQDSYVWCDQNRHNINLLNLNWTVLCGVREWIINIKNYVLVDIYIFRCSRNVCTTQIYKNIYSSSWLWLFEDPS